MELLLDKYISSSDWTTKRVIKSIHDEHLQEWINFLQALPRLKQSDELLLQTVRVIGLKLTKFSSKEEELCKLGKSSSDKQLHILKATCSNEGFIQTVKAKIIEWSLKPDKKAHLEQLYLLMFAFCNEILKEIPELGPQFLCNLVFTVSRVVQSSGFLNGVDEVILTGFQGLEKKLQKINPDTANKENRKCPDLLREYQQLLRQQEGDPPNDFRTLEITPTLDEVLGKSKVFIRPNKIMGPYDNQDHYLDVQFRLLKEDFVTPLRKSVMEYSLKERSSNPQQQLKDNSVRIYNDVRFTKTETSKENGTDYLFSLNQAFVRTVNWDKSKRLLPGCLVMLSADNLKTVIFALTQAPPFEGRKQFGKGVASGAGDPRRRELASGVLRLILQINDVTIRTGTKFVMFESEAYFEAYRYNLRILQNITFLVEGQNPMAKFIVKAYEHVMPPKYMSEVSDPKILLPFQDDRGSLTVSATRPWTWPGKDIMAGMQLNEHQYEALKMALTSELAIIQGPPGTGKTHVGLQIVKTLILNKKQKQNDRGNNQERMFGGIVYRYDGGNGNGGMSSSAYNQRFGGNQQPEPWGDVVPPEPFLVLCYTNHALDQFLELLLNKMPKLGVVRVGGQCKSDKLNPFTLANIRRDLIAKIGELPEYKKYRIRESKALRHKNEVESAILRLKVEMEELEKPNGLFNWRGMDVAMKMNQMRLVPKRIMDAVKQEKWFQLDWEMFEKRRFNLEGFISHGFDKTFAEIEKKLPNDVANWERKVVQEVKGQEDYDLDELLENRVEEEDLFQEVVNAGMDFDAERYRNSIYMEAASVRDCELRAEQLRKQRNAMITQTEDNAQKLENKGKFLKGLLALCWGRTITPLKLDDRSWMDVWTGVAETHVRYRWAVYFKIVELAKRAGKKLEGELQNQLLKAKEAVENARLALWQAREEYLKHLENLNTHILQNCDVIGMTTTGAAKNHQLLERAGCKVVIVEEAAEILEAHIVTALTEHCQHLILIGDHQQLRPSVTVYELGKDYQLNVSLFERMIGNNVPYKTLKTQHRMRPEICNLIRGPVYEDLLNHSSVEQFPLIKGVMKSVFFVNHKQFEDNDKELLSKSNTFEARYLAGLCHYLIKQSYDASKITVLTMYAGQMFLLKKLLGRDLVCRGVRVTCVDNFQGEENDIILLSLVRSNQGHNLGFVGVDNRVCVALSRAKKGLYIIGNMECLCGGGRGNRGIWGKVNRKLRQADCIGEGLEVVCEMHGKVSCIKRGEEWEYVKNGGCDMVCRRKLDCGHSCEKRCWETCGECKIKVNRLMTCGHFGWVECGGGNGQAAVRCEGVSEKYLLCGHKRLMRCWESTDGVKCDQKRDVVLPCGHKFTVDCAAELPKEIERQKCEQDCGSLLPCGHACGRRCHWNNVFDRETHWCTGFYCQKKCANGVHGCHSRHPCQVECPPCQGQMKKMLLCGHGQQRMPCTMPVEKYRCVVRVTVDLKCGHKTKRITCYESVQSAFLCDAMIEKRIPTCGHFVRLKCHQPVELVECEVLVQGICTYCQANGPVKCGSRVSSRICNNCVQRKRVAEGPSDPRSGSATKRPCSEQMERNKEVEEEEVVVLFAGKREKVLDDIVLE